MYGGRLGADTIHGVGKSAGTDVSGIDSCLLGGEADAPEETTRMLTTADLDSFFADGWNRHDVDVLMTFMADDCVFESATGPETCGTRHVGRERVRAAFAQVFASYPDAGFRDARHFVVGDRGVSEWVFTATGADGRRIEVDGCDLFTFRGGKIARKSSFFKNRST
jgi:steroid delta-isomerase-like uncharacterized protein